jgi:hypothetical protein
MSEKKFPSAFKKGVYAVSVQALRENSGHFCEWEKWKLNLELNNNGNNIKLNSQARF